MDALEVYGKTQSLAPTTFFWICSLALRQCQAEVELASNMARMPSTRALQLPSMVGTVLITSEAAPAMSRIWCLFEMYEAIVKPGHNLDLCILSSSISSVSILGTMDRRRDWKTHDIQEITAERLLEVHVRFSEHSKASDESTRRLLLRRIESTTIFSQFDKTLRRHLAGPALLKRASRGDKFGVLELLNLEGSTAPRLTSHADVHGTALHHAAIAGHTEVAQEILAAHADINSQDERDQRTPLMLCTFWGKIETAQMLLRAGAAIDKQDKYGQTASDMSKYMLRSLGTRQDMLMLARLAEVSQGYSRLP